MEITNPYARLICASLIKGIKSENTFVLITKMMDHEMWDCKENYYLVPKQSFPTSIFLFPKDEEFFEWANNKKIHNWKAVTQINMMFAKRDEDRKKAKLQRQVNDQKSKLQRRLHKATSHAFYLKALCAPLVFFFFGLFCFFCF